jgi:hypothetical protein
MHYDLRERVLPTVTAITVGCAAALAFAPNSASAITAIPAVYGGETDGRIVQEVGEKGRHGHRYRHHHHHHYYGYRPYRPYYGYGYRPDYYYGYYGYPYRYWGRPDVSIGFSF